jgi:predicted RNA-binding protein YlxR (DUF448 family)
MLAVIDDNVLDGGTTSVAPGSERHCALTRELKPVSELIRFVVGPGGEVVPDIKRKLPGRGLWITGTHTAVAEAAKRNVFARGFKRDVRLSSDLAGAVGELLVRSALDALAIAGKAGRAVTGFAKVEAALACEDVVALIHAADAGGDGTRKLNAILRRQAAKSRETTVIDLFCGAQLDLALNRPNVVHAALLAGPGSDTFVERAARLRRFQVSTVAK